MMPIASSKSAQPSPVSGEETKIKAVSYPLSQFDPGGSLEDGKTVFVNRLNKINLVFMLVCGVMSQQLFLSGSEITHSAIDDEFTSHRVSRLI